MSDNINDFIDKLQSLLMENKIIIIKTNYRNIITNWDDKILSKKINDEVYIKVNNKVLNRKIGEIEITKNTAEQTLRHKSFKTPSNVEMLFNAPILFENAKLLKYTKNWKNRNYDSYLCGCLIHFNHVQYIVEILINKYKIGKNKFRNQGYIMNIVERSSLEDQAPYASGCIITSGNLSNTKSIIIDTLKKSITKKIGE